MVKTVPYKQFLNNVFKLAYKINSPYFSHQSEHVPNLILYAQEHLSFPKLCYKIHQGLLVRPFQYMHHTHNCGH